MLRILFLAANPHDTPPLALKAEALAIEDKLRQASLLPNVELHYAWGITVDEIAVQLRRLVPNILHFSGHGSRKGGLVIETSSGKGFALPSAALVHMVTLLGRQVRGVLLNACSMRHQAELLAEHVDCVIGMEHEIRDSSAQHFSTSFYTSLASGDSVSLAFQLGKGRIRSSGAADSDAPQLFLRSGVVAEQLRFVQRVQIFAIYAKEDEDSFRTLSLWLKPLQRAARIELRGLHELPPGAANHELLEQRIEETQLFLLLISQSFLASDECYELGRRVLQRRTPQKAAVVPIIVGPCDWQDSPFGGLQSIRVADARPLSTPELRDSAWQRATRELHAIIRAQEQLLLAR